MQQYISEQLKMFLFALMTGAIISIIYDIFRIIRLAFNNSTALIVAEDIIFSFIALSITVMYFSAFNFGQIRLYLLIGLLSGAIICHITIGHIIIATSKIIILIFKRIFLIIFYPIKLIFKAICKFFKKIYKILKKDFIFFIKRVIIIKSKFIIKKGRRKTNGKSKIKKHKYIC